MGRWVNRDPIEEDGGLNIYNFVNSNPINFIDILGEFSIQGHAVDWGHIGIKTVFNGAFRYYDFGRYYGMYKDAKWYDGPNILRRSSKAPYYRSYTGYDAFEFRVTKKLDNIISQKFRDKWDSGETDIPEEIKKEMVQYKRKKKPNFIKIKDGDRYMGSNWAPLGRNCVSFTFNVLYEALDEVIEGEKYTDALKCEAQETKKKVSKIKGLSLRPKAILNNFSGSPWESSFYNKEGRN